jgi:DNA-binding NarL/FixJ family response regulator
MSPPRLLLVDDHPLVCEGLRTILEPANLVVGTTHSGDNVLAMVEETRPDVVLLDLSLPGRNGISIIRSLRRARPRPKVLVVTMHAERVYADEALAAGADGFVLKLATAHELRLAVREVAAGRQFFSPRWPNAARRPAADAPERSEIHDPLVSLTLRQRQVLHLIGEGLSSGEMASRLDLSVKAIEYHRSTLRGVLALASSAALVRFAALYAERADDPGTALGDRPTMA